MRFRNELSSLAEVSLYIVTHFHTVFSPLFIAYFSSGKITYLIPSKRRSFFAWLWTEMERIFIKIVLFRVRRFKGTLVFALAAWLFWCNRNDTWNEQRQEILSHKTRYTNGLHAVSDRDGRGDAARQHGTCSFMNTELTGRENEMSLWSLSERWNCKRCLFLKTLKTKVNLN